MSVSRAHDLFDRLRLGTTAALDQLIEEREPESLFLDFKRSSADGAARNLASDDNKNLSKAISGFANSSGGVVVWGVDCRRESLSGNEMAEKHPLIDAAGFNTKLQAAISRATVPPLPGVELVSFEEQPGVRAGFVAVLVPQSLAGPIRSVVTNHYHIRVGSDFSIVPHDVLAGMFGRAPQPSVDLNLISRPARLDARPGFFSVSLGIVAVNLGAVIAERPYITIFFGDFPQDLLVVQSPDRENLKVRRGLLPTCSIVASPGFIIAPGATEHLCDVVLDVPVGQPRSIALNCILGVLGAPPQRFTLEASLEAVANGMASARAGSLQSSQVVTLAPGN